MSDEDVALFRSKAILDRAVHDLRSSGYTAHVANYEDGDCFGTIQVRKGHEVAALIYDSYLDGWMVTPRSAAFGSCTPRDRCSVVELLRRYAANNKDRIDNE